MVNQVDDQSLVEPVSLVDDVVEDESDSDESVPTLKYGITSFGADLDIFGLVRRLNNGEIFIPDWQRSFVWPIKTASGFIESILFGLPVPEVFMGVERGTNKYYVIDGQQRLRTLQGFYEGTFPGRASKFKLTGVDGQFEGLAYTDLSDEYRRELDNYLIHATIVRQDTPAYDDTSMYQIFKRLNSGSRQVNPHEIRCAVYQGGLIDLLRKLNENPDWRLIIGRASLRLKDQEMILRFMAMLYNGHEYTRPMSEFLNVFTQTNRHPDNVWMRDASKLFNETVKAFADSKGRDAFRVSGGRVANAAIFDSMSVGLANSIMAGNSPDKVSVQQIHDRLILDAEYLQAVTQATSGENSVITRLRIARNAFANA